MEDNKQTPPADAGLGTDDIKALIEQNKQLARQIEEATRKISEQGERISQLSVAGSVPGGDASGYQRGSSYQDPAALAANASVDLFENPELWKKNVVSEVVSSVANVIEQREAGRKIEQAFYSKYPELAKAKEVVDSVAVQYKMQNPSARMDKAFEDIANRTREILGVTSLPPVGQKAPAFEAGGQGVADKAAAPSQPVKSDSEQQKDDAMEWMNRNRKTQPA